MTSVLLHRLVSRLLIFSFLVLNLLLSCSASRPQVTEDPFFQPRAFFLESNPSEASPDLAAQAGLGGAFLAGRFVALNLYPQVDPLPFYLWSLEHEPVLFAQASVSGITEHLGVIGTQEGTGQNNQEQNLSTIDTILSLIGSRIQNPEESHYWQLAQLRPLARWYYDNQWDQELLELLEIMDQRFAFLSLDSEGLLWQIVATQRTTGILPQESIDVLNRNFRATGIHWRLDRYIQTRPELIEQLDPQILSMLVAKAAISQGQFRGNSEALSDQFLPTATYPLLWDLYNASVQSGNRVQLAQRFQNATSQVQVPQLQVTLWEHSGRLFALAGRNTEAQTAFYTALSLIATQWDLEVGSTQGQRILWNWFRAAIRQGTGVAMNQLPTLATWVEDPFFFHDHLHDFISQLIRDQNWNRLGQLYGILQPVLSQPMEARVTWILAELQRLNLLPEPFVFESNSWTRIDFLQLAANQNQDPYYRAVAQIALALDREISQPDSTNPLLPLTSAIPLSTIPLVVPITDHQDFLRSLYHAGFNQDGYNLAFRNPETFDEEHLILFVGKHHNNQNYIDGMRLIERWIRVQEPETLSEELVSLRYPLAFQSEMEQVITDYDLEAALFYGLVREESYFDPTIGSAVGARGLSQLMPATANDMAQLLRLQNPDLVDPETNLRIGSYYYRRLLNRFTSHLQALIAYNAGQGRMNGWRVDPWARSSILLHEGLPFEETRHYIRKIFVSAVHYNQYHFDLDPAQILEHLFPELLR